MTYNNHILVVDDNQSIHDDFRKVLYQRINAARDELNSLEKKLFGDEIRIEGKHELQEVYEVDFAYQGEQALEMVKQTEKEGRPYALIFMDVRMPPGWDGIETISRIWENHPFIEVVICTAYSDYTLEEIVDKLGASDKLLFLRKPFDPTAVRQMTLTLLNKWNLGAQSRNYVKNLEHDVDKRTLQLQKLLVELEEKNSELANANRELEYIALHDALTQLPNRTLFNDRLQHSVFMAARNRQAFGVAVMDLNRFKEINDEEGHFVGDKVLQEVGKRLSGLLRKSDTIARIGGDEFAFIFYSAAKESMDLMAKKITQLFETPIVVENKTLNLGTSVGIVMYPEHAEDDVTLMKYADIALQQAKQGGVEYVLFDVEENSRRTDRLRLISDLEYAIFNNGLSLNYQPIIDFSTNRVCGAEALSRWVHPEKGFISPDEFISLAEHNGLIEPLTLWVLNTALKQCKEWHKSGVMISISVNLSARNFLDPSLLGKLELLLKHWDLDAKWLSLEITESMTMSDPERALEILDSLDKMGVRLSIDDFGTGYSSLSYLKKFPVDELKIDRVFVMDMDQDHDNQVIVRSTIDLAHTLGLKVVAEGIENETVMTLLNQCGCNKAQGYYLCRPQSAADFNRWLQESEWAGALKDYETVNS